MGLRTLKDRSQKISLCKQCDGTGTVENSELEDYHKGEYRYWNTVCDTCKGTGRLRTTITTITEIEPYDNSEVTMLLLKDTEDK